MEPLKRQFLELLDKDLEFRYAVAGYLGLSEILKRLEDLSEEQVKLREEQIKLREEQTKIWKEISGLREEQISLREEQTKIWNEIRGLREDFNMMLKEIRSIDIRLGRVERTLEKLTVDIEDEARSIIKYRLKKDLGLDLEVGSLTLPELELNIYGASDDTCVVGEASVRGGARMIHELIEKVETLKGRYPEKLREKTIPVIYVCMPLPELVEEAKKRKIWVLKATKDFHKPPLIEAFPPK